LDSIFRADPASFFNITVQKIKRGCTAPLPRHSTHARVPEAAKGVYRMNYGLGVYQGKFFKKLLV